MNTMILNGLKLLASKLIHSHPVLQVYKFIQNLYSQLGVIAQIIQIDLWVVHLRICLDVFIFDKGSFLKHFSRHPLQYQCDHTSPETLNLVPRQQSSVDHVVYLLYFTL